MDIAFHRRREDIESDLEYYFSDQRDKHNQIRPSDDIRSLTPDSELLRPDWQAGEVGNLFFPYPIHSIDRIFIGISFPLYANNFGAAFLRYLLELITPDGAIILPVYPEIQALEKGLWCRSALENIFRSRSRFVGISNIWAENDGVMSMRVGRRWPPVIPSIARWIFEQESRNVLASALAGDSQQARARWLEHTRRLWQVAQYQAILEQIIRDHYRPRQAIRIGLIGEDSGWVALECLMSPYLRVTHASAIGGLESIPFMHTVARHCATTAIGTLSDEPLPDQALDVLMFCSDANENAPLPEVRRGGLRITTPDVVAQPWMELAPAEDREFYSSRVAQQLKEGVTIHHYSTPIETEIANEAATRQGVFQISRVS